MSIRSKGHYVVKRLRPRYEETAEASQIIVPFVGPFDALWSGRPAINSTLSGFPSDHTVKKVSMEDGRANDGRLIVTLERPAPGSTGSNENAQIGESIYELDWGEERRPLEEHEKAPHLAPDRPEYEFPDKAWDSQINYGWPPGEAPEGKIGVQRSWDNWAALDSSDVIPIDWDVDDYKALRRKGFVDFPHAFPIARSTIFAKYRIASSGGVQAVGSPPGQCGAPGGWIYVKTASRSTKQGSLYSLIEEWRGFSKVEPSLLH